MGDISPDEYENFTGEDIRPDPIILKKDTTIPKLLEYYMGKNNPDRQGFIIDNLRVEKDVVETLTLSPEAMIEE